MIFSWCGSRGTSPGVQDWVNLQKRKKILGYPLFADELNRGYQGNSLSYYLVVSAPVPSPCRISIGGCRAVLAGFRETYS
jgi:hypothetical protein